MYIHIYNSQPTLSTLLSNQSRSGGWFVFPVWWQDRNGSVVSSQSVDSWFDQNQSELRVLVFSVSLQVLSDRDSLLDQEVQIFWNFWSQTVGFQDSQDLVTSNNLGLWNTVSISQDNTNRRWSQTLSSVLDDLFNNIIAGQFEPWWCVSWVWNGGGRNTFTL